MALTELTVRNAKGREKPYKLADTNGLYLLVQPAGTRLWRMNYRYQAKQKTMAFGTYPLVGLAEAREKRDDARKQIANGNDPGLKKKLDKIAAQVSAENTWASVVTDYLERVQHDGAAERTYAKIKWLLEGLTVPDLGTRPVTEITTTEWLTLLQKIERTGRLETARRLRATVSQVYRFAIVGQKATLDPTAALQGVTKPPKVTNHAAIVEPKKLGALLLAIDEYDGWPTLRCALQFQALVAARPGEVRCAEWSEFDLKAAKWTIPAQRTKMRREHEVPLCRQALAVLSDVEQITGGQTLVFSSIRSMARPLSENAMNAALRRMGYTNSEHTAHGFRSSFSTIMNDNDFDAEVIEICLAHQDKNKIRGTYNKAKKWPQRVKMMDDWADLLDGFRKLASAK